MKTLFTHHFAKPLLLVFCFLAAFTASSQSLYDLWRGGTVIMGRSKENSRNINHPDGTKYQDLKRATGIIVTLNATEQCSCTLLNAVNQDKKLYILTAAHCFNFFSSIGNVLGIFISFNYEMSGTVVRGKDDNKNDTKITRGYRVKVILRVRDIESDILLLEIQDEDDTKIEQLFQYVYAAGWDNSFANKGIANISHPMTDHKKIYFSPADFETFFKQPNSGDTLLNMAPPEKGYTYLTYSPWNGNNVTIEKGSSGSGLYNGLDRLMGVLSSVINGSLYKSEDPRSRIPNYTIFTSISNSWYQNGTALPEAETLSHYLDPDKTWVGSIPGGYYNDMITTEGSDFTLELASSEIAKTPGIDPANAAQLKPNVIELPVSVLFRYSNQIPQYIYDWERLVGLKVTSSNFSNVLLEVYYLHFNGTVYKKVLLYGGYANSSTTANAEGFRLQAWDCNDPLFPDCKRNNLFNQPPIPGDMSNDSRQIITRILQELQASNNRLGVLNTTIGMTIPVQIELENDGAEDVIVQAVSYPGDVPRNALQLFEKEAFEAKFKSYKYKESRGRSSDDLHITQLKVSHTPVSTGISREITIPTGNNGGYVNLVNPNFKILDGGVELSYRDAQGDPQINSLTFIFDVHNPSGEPYSYAIYLDYFNAEREGEMNLLGVNRANHTYNFVNDPEPHQEELVTSAPSRTDPTITYPYSLPDYSAVRMAAGTTRKTRLRIAVKRGDVVPRQDEIFDFGEVEDYLIELRALDPNCLALKPDTYKQYAEPVLPFCGTGGYWEVKETLTSSYRVTAPGSLVFQTGKVENVRYASAKAIPSFYESAANYLSGSSTNTNANPALTGFNQNLMCISTTEQEVDVALLIDQNMMMDIYYPLPENGKTLDDLDALPLIIYHFGGAFVWNTRQSTLTQKTCEWLASRGYVVAAIDYRVGLYPLDDKMSRRAMIRAWQDSRTAVKWWRMPQNQSHDEGSNLWKIDPNRIYALGHSAGGITSQANLYLTEDKFDMEIGDADNPGFLIATSDQYSWYEPGEGGRTVKFQTYDLQSYKPIPCLKVELGKSVVNTCDVLLKDINNYGGYEDDEINKLLDAYFDISGRADKAASFAGAIAKTEWMFGPYSRPSTEIHHLRDGVVPYWQDFPVLGGTLGGLINLTVLEIDQVYGGGAMYEAWDSQTYASQKGIFRVLSLYGETEGGGGGDAPFHVPQYKFGSLYNDYLGGGEPELEDAIMYYVDAFFMRDWTANPFARMTLQTDTETALQEQQEEETPIFNMFPNPAGDEVNIIVGLKEAGPLTIELVGMQGKQAYRHHADYVGAGDQWIQLGNLDLADGTYIMNLTAKGLVKQEKLVISKSVKR